jgi:hypothetical protein
MKKGKSITFQLQDPFEKELYAYCNELHNCSGSIKRLIASSEGFDTWRKKKAAREQQIGTRQPIKSQGGGIKINLT